MKKTIFFIILLFGVFTVFNLSLATSGACSYHNGVNCSAGMQSDGTVFCNDGWTDSITYYDFTAKCKNNTSCYYPSNYYPTYSNRQNIEEVEKECKDSVHSLYVGAGLAGSEMMKNALNECDKKTESYTKELDSYNELIRLYEECKEDEYKEKINLINNSYKEHTSPKKINNADDLCKQNYGENAIQASENGMCTCKDGYIWAPDGKNLCIPDCKAKYGDNTILFLDKYCFCKNDYKFNESHTKCIKKTCPSNSSLTEGECFCNAKYKWNNDKTECKLKCPETSHEHKGKCICDNKNDIYIGDIIGCLSSDVTNDTNIPNNKNIENTITQKTPKKIPVQKEQTKIMKIPSVDKNVELLNVNTTTESVKDKQVTSTEIVGDKQIKNNIPQIQEKESIMQKVKKGAGSAIKHAISFVKNIFNKLKFW